MTVTQGEALTHPRRVRTPITYLPTTGSNRCSWTRLFHAWRRRLQPLQHESPGDEANLRFSMDDGSTLSASASTLIQIRNSTAPPQVSNNVVTKNLRCGNNSSITGGGNTAQSKQAQCITF